MKKTFLISCISACGFLASAQSLDLGLKGGYGSTWLLNSNVYNGSIQKYVTSYTPSFAFHAELNFIGGTGIELEVIDETFTQKHEGTFKAPAGPMNLGGTIIPYAVNESYTSTTKFSELKIPILFHYQGALGFSLEVGPEFGTISSPSFSASYTSQPPLTPSSYSYSPSGSFASSNVMGVLGVGWNFKLIPTGKLYLLTDLRFEYGFTDIKGLDAFGQDMTNASASNSALKGYYSYTSYAGTHTAEATLSIGLFYRIGLTPKI
jgi:hypothetical protein